MEKSFRVLLVLDQAGRNLADQIEKTISIPSVVFERLDLPSLSPAELRKGDVQMNLSVQESHARESAESADAALFLVGRELLLHPLLDGCVRTVEGSGKPFVAIALEPLDGVDRPVGLGRARWLQFLEPGDLARVTQAVVDFLWQLIREPRSEPNARTQDGPSETREMQILEGDASSPTAFKVSEDLAQFLGFAARFNRQSPDEKDFPISFSSILLALFNAPGSWNIRARAIHAVAGFDGDAILARKKLDLFSAGRIAQSAFEPHELAQPLRATSSAAQLLRTARMFATRFETTADVRHVVAALVFSPGDHEAELAQLRFPRRAFAAAVIEDANTHAPTELELWKSLQQSLPVDPAIHGMRMPTPDVTEAAWGAAADDLKLALSWAWSMAKTRAQASNVASAPVTIGIDALFGGLVRADPEIEQELVEVLVSHMTKQAGDSTDPGQILWARLGLPPAATLEPLASMPSCTPDVANVLSNALAARPTDRATLGSGDVFLALWRPPSPNAAAPIDALLLQLRLDGDDFLAAALAKQLEHGGSDPGIQAILDLRRRQPSWSLPKVDNDSVDGDQVRADQDLLDARKPALRFAKLLAAEKVNPPIALGLFGNWGSGKTFFMGLMRDAIRDLTAKQNPNYVQRVVQIEFNAWHYQDTHLWASLALRIFEKLANELSERKETTPEARRRELNQRISSSQTQRVEAESRRSQALGKRTQAAKDLALKRTEREELLRRSVSARFEAAWQAFTQDDEYKKACKTVADLKKQFGIDAALDSASDLEHLRDEVGELCGKTYGVAKAIGARFRGAKAIVWTSSLLALVVLFALAAGFGVERLAQVFGAHIPQLSGIVIQLSVIVSTVAAWVSRRVHSVSNAVDMLANINAKLAEREKGASTEEIRDLVAQIARLDQDIHKASEEVNEAEKQIADATAEIERINRGGLVYDFLTERSAATVYTGQLGLVSTIRRDFEQLEELLKDFQLFGDKPINRIILYIDDLDRCQPEKVIEVLQAVHLLLAFKLFNVVVGVDARWLERALWREYVGKLGLARKDDANEFSPQDYLEKIFQIPYALSAIDKTGFESLVGGMIQTRSEWRAEQRKEAEVAAAKAAAERDAIAAATPARVAAPDAMPGAGGVTAGAKLVAAAAGATAEPAQATTTTGVAPAAGVDIGSALFFEDHEERFIKRLYAFIDRPRLAKRFINIYRLLRVRADDEGEGTQLAASASSPDYRAALVLLAINVGQPRVAGLVMRAVARAKPTSTWPQVLDDLVANKVHGIAVAPEEHRALIREIELIRERMSELGQEVPVELDPYRRWAPRVACFSFDWHHSSVAGKPNVPAIPATSS